MNEVQALFLIGIIVFLSGCINLSTSPSFYKNDVITVENYVLTDAEPIPGSTTTIKFNIMNNGDRPVPKAFVNFFDTKNLATNVDCKSGIRLSDSSCEYDNIPSLDDRSFAITFKMPTKEDVKGPITLTFNYEIDYNYQGSRRIILPIIDDTKIKEPITKFQTGQPSIGPVTADFDPPVGRTTKQNNQVVKEYWGVKGYSFEISVKFSEVASNVVGNVKPVNLTAGRVNLRLSGMVVDPERRCDFSGTSGTIYSAIDVTIPGSPNNLVCNFRALDFTGREKTVAIDANFAYTIQILRSETITIVPQKLAQTNLPQVTGQQGTGSQGNPPQGNAPPQGI